jgi:hypothetical protein
VVPAKLGYASQESARALICAVGRQIASHHDRAKAFFAALRRADALLTTWPVITERAFVMRHWQTLL